MARRSSARPSKAEQAATFLVALQQLETVATEVDLNWPEQAKADAIRRLNRLIRALRTAPADAKTR